MPYRSRSSRPVSVSSAAAFGLPFSSSPAVSPCRLRSRGARVVSVARSLVPVGSSSFSRMSSHLLVPNGRRPRPGSPTSLGPQPGLVNAPDGLQGFLYANDSFRLRVCAVYSVRSLDDEGRGGRVGALSAGPRAGGGGRRRGRPRAGARPGGG